MPLAVLRFFESANIADAQLALRVVTLMVQGRQQSARNASTATDSGHETPHLALPLTRRLVGEFGSMVRVLISDVDHGRHHGAVADCRGRRRSAATFRMVGDQSSRECVWLPPTALGFQQRPKE